jgi:hypothetical protein
LCNLWFDPERTYTLGDLIPEELKPCPTVSRPAVQPMHTRHCLLKRIARWSSVGTIPPDSFKRAL